MTIGRIVAIQKMESPLYIRIGCVTDCLAAPSDYQIDGVYAHQETGNQWSYDRDKRVWVLPTGPDTADRGLNAAWHVLLVTEINGRRQAHV